MAVVVLMAEFLTVREVSMSGGGGGGGGRSALAVKVEAVLSVVELLVVSDRSRYLKFSLTASSWGLEVLLERHGDSRMMLPLVSTPKRAGEAYLMEGPAYLTEGPRLHSTVRGSALFMVTLASAASSPAGGEGPYLNSELTQSCTWLGSLSSTIFPLLSTLIPPSSSWREALFT